MNRTKRGVTVLKSLGNNTHRTNIKKLLKRKALFLHFFPNAEYVLRTAVNLCANFFAIKQALQVAYYGFYVLGALSALAVKLMSYLLVGDGV